jgi:hypothetical protein
VVNFRVKAGLVGIEGDDAGEFARAGFVSIFSGLKSLDCRSGCAIVSHWLNLSFENDSNFGLALFVGCGSSL